ncbi:MAG: DUF1624 domain-containing protein [Atopobiaceae bacterium]|jgi:uncharacterized membrane protein|nr:DUF1624 domain-containing protein [Atopobiaceae bacterium]MCI2173233.1 DUF1624 domain-containing protein [Atopobiaceae bacterium]MCI2207228.1 DUF1624 domain-containing protein [Atopobiaceae bacterium]
MRSPKTGEGHRYRLFDVLRGIAVLSMVGFHLCYDLVYLDGIKLGWFTSPQMDVWRASISWTFLLIAGIMCSLSRDNLKRASRYLIVAGLVFIVTSVADVDIPISFGIIFCMGASTLVEWLLQKCRLRPKGWIAAAALFAAFVIMLDLPNGSVGLPGLMTDVPRMLYSSDWFSWLGLPGPHFMSGDYYPLIPYTLLFLCGSSIGWQWKESGYPTVFKKIGCIPLEWVGRHALAIYVLHQPVLLLLTALIGVR